MRLIKNIFNLNLLLIGLSAIFLYILISGCVKSSIKIEKVDSKTKPETEKINITENVVKETKENKRLSAEKKAKAIKEAKAAAVAQLANKKKAEQAVIANLKKSLDNAENSPGLKSSERIKIVLACLKILKKDSLKSDDISKAEAIVLKSRALHLLGQNREALSVLIQDWKSIILPDKKLKANGSLHSSPSAEAYYIKGKIYLILARKESENSKAKALYKNAVKSYYTVLSLYDANKCPYSTLSVTGFNQCRQEMLKRFKIKVGFPPEGME